MDKSTYGKERYRTLRAQGLCVSCKRPSAKSRCPDCMKDVEYAVKKSKKKRLGDLKNRIKELEAMLGMQQEAV